MTLADLGAVVPCDASTGSKIEAGQLRPTERFVTACIETFPPLEWLGRFYEESQMWGDGAIPRWFEDWLNAEREATTLRIWQPLLVPGLLQTADYARALFLGGLLNPSEDAIDQLVAARLARQSIFDRPDPPNLWIILDEIVLHRLIGTPKTMYDQLLQVADMSMRSYMCVQVYVRASCTCQLWRTRGPGWLVLYRQRARQAGRGRPQQQRQERVRNPSRQLRCAC